MSQPFRRWAAVTSLVLGCATVRPLAAQERTGQIPVAEPLTYTVVYSDSLGSSHFAERQVEFELVDYAPPAPPISASRVTEVGGLVYISSPAGWFGDWHPAPRRQLIFCLAGVIEVTVSDGEVRRFAPGEVILVEDTRGQGHVTRVIGEDRAYLVAVSIPAAMEE